MNRRARVLVGSFFSAYLLVGLFAHRTYGISWDEGYQHRIGEVNALYVEGQLARLFQGRVPTAEESELLSFRDRHYGPFLEAPLYWIQQALGLDDSRQIYLMRHLATFLIVYCGVVAFFFLVRGRHGDWRVALVGCAMLILTPRIFAHSFYNAKDLGFLALFIVAMYTLRRLWLERTVLNAVLHAGSCAALITTRIGGLLIPVLTFVAIGPDLVRQRHVAGYVKRNLAIGSLYIVLLGALTIALWPYLWNDPVGSFREAYAKAGEFRWGLSVLYMGDFVPSFDLPWHYLPVWVGITTPIAYTVLFGVGVSDLTRSLLRSRFRFEWHGTAQEDLLYAAMLFIPVAGVTVQNIVVYDDWRHLYFVYPAFLMLALRGLLAAWTATRDPTSGPWIRRAAAVGLLLVAVNVLATATWMARNHPHQYVYFNALAGNDTGRKFEMDYWGLSYRQGLEYVLRTDDSAVIAVSVANLAGTINHWILEPADRDRIRLVEEGEGAYFLSNFRYESEYRRHLASEFPYADEVWTLKIDGEPIMGVYRTGY